MLIQLKSKQLEVLKLYDFLNILLTVWLYMLFFKFYSFCRNGSAVSLNGFEIVLRQLQKLAPELHRVSLGGNF